MTEIRDGQRTGGSSIAWSMPQVADNPLLAVVTDINGKLLESVASAQKDWVEFVHRRIKEDFAASRQLVNCQSLADIPQIYSQYLRSVFEHYREQSERVVQRGKSMTKELAQTMESREVETTQQAPH